MRTDFYIYCLLSSIPWNARALYEKHSTEFEDLLESIKSYIGYIFHNYSPLVYNHDIKLYDLYIGSDRRTIYLC